MTREVKETRWREGGEGRSYKTEKGDRKIERRRNEKWKKEMRRVKETLEKEETKCEKEQ